MKIIKIIFCCLLALSLIACMGVFILFQTFNTDQYLPQITNKASHALGRPVSIKHVGLGLSLSGITLDAWPLTVADDPNFTTQPFMRIDRVRISLDLESLILRREIHITHLLLQSPQIHFIRSENGNMNVSSISGVVASHKGGAISARTVTPREITSSLENAALRSASSNDKIKVGSEPNNLFKQFPIIKSITIQDAAISFIDQNSAMPLDIWLVGINMSLNDFSFSKPLPILLNASLYSNTPNVHVNASVFCDPSTRSVHVSDLTFQMDLSHLNIDQLKDISTQNLDSSIFKDIPGRVQLNMSNLDIGPSGTIEAKGDINITGGVIKHFNIVKALLFHAMDMFGGMGVNIDHLLDQSKLGAEDTTIEKAQAKFSVHDKIISIDDSLLQTDIFELTAKGPIKQDFNMDMQTMLHLNNDVSMALVNQFDGLKYLMDDSKRIAIGASLTGVPPHLKYKPNKDFRKKSRRILIEEGGNILGVLLGGGKKSSSDQDSSSSDSGKKSKKGFRNIFKSLIQ